MFPHHIPIAKYVLFHYILNRVYFQQLVNYCHQLLFLPYTGMSSNQKTIWGADPPLELKKRLRDKHHQLLLLLVRNGNEDAFQRLYREIYDPVAAYVNRRVNNTADAEDIIAGVFHKFLTRLDSFESTKGSVLTWVVSMTRHAVIDHHRRVRPATVNSDEMAEILAGTRPGVLQQLIREEDLQRVQGLLLKQAPDIREMFGLRFGQGLRVREVAAVMGISEDAAKQRFARTLKQLQLQLRDEKNTRKTGKGETPWAVTN